MELRHDGYDVLTFSNLAEAIGHARSHAEEGLRAYPFDAIYKTTLGQLHTVTASLRDDGTLAPLISDSITLAIMAAKELGNEERDFAHALHVIQRYADDAMRNASYSAST